MTGPIIPLRPAASEGHRQDERGHHNGREVDGAPKDFAEDVAKGTPVHQAAVKQFFKHCGTCGAILILCLAWMLGLVPKVSSPFAMAADFEKVRGVFQEVLTRQISADIRAYQASLCIGANPFLEGELERAQVAYEKQTGRRYPMVACPARD